MTDMHLPVVFNEAPTRCDIKQMPGIRLVGVAVKIARKIHVRCRLAEAQNWRCCWCGNHCVPDSGYRNSATIEHVTPRSLGGSDDWANLAMACASCNHRRGAISVDDMLAGRLSQTNSHSKVQRHKAKTVEKYIRKAIHWNQNGWKRADGSPLCRDEWLESLHVTEKKHRERIAAIVFGEAD